ncbi:MAG: TonB-dependent receptor [Chitinispirillaceae bacterium]|jgi:vitamin B12 transporter
MNAKACISSAVIFLFPIFAFAQDTVSLADSGHPYTIVVTATRREQPSEWVADDHKEIDVEKQSGRSSKSVAEMLAASIPAWFADNGGGAVKTVSLRGAGSERTLVLVDGQRIGTIDGDLGGLSPEMIERIEIVEGGQSALYGMDAVGGVVNIITKKPVSEKLSGSFSATAASYEPQDNEPRLDGQCYNLCLGQKLQGIEWLFGADLRKSDGKYEYEGLNNSFQEREHNGYMDWGIHPKIGYNDSSVAVTLSGSLSGRNADGPGSTDFPDTNNTRQTISYIGLNGRWTAGEFLTLRANSSFGYDYLHYRSVSQESWNTDRNGSLELVQDFTFGKQLLTTGMQGLFQSAISNEYGHHTGNQGSVFASGILEQSVQDLVFRETPAVRYDYSSIFKGALDGKAGLIATWKVPAEPSLFFNIGNAFKSPAFSDLYWPQDAWSIGNPHLKPERSVDWDIGAQLHHRVAAIDYSGRITYFRMRLNDMIIWEPRPDFVWTPVNVAAATIRGCKISTQLRLFKMYATSFDCAYSLARDANTGKTLIYRPRYAATYTNALEAGRITFGITVRYSSEVFTDESNTGQLPASTIFDANLGIKIASVGEDGDARLVYDILNLTDEQHVTNEGYPLPGREHRLSLKLSF